MIPNTGAGGLPAVGGQTGAAGQLGGVFGQRASPYLGAVLRGITGGANFQQPQQTPRYLNTYAPGSGQGYLGGSLMGRFNPTGYLNANPDVAAAVSRGDFPSALTHFQQYGLREGRSPTGLGVNIGAPAQWMAPRQAPPGMNPTSVGMPGIQYAQASQMPYLPQQMPAGYTAPGTAAGPAQGQVQQDPFMAKWFPSWDPNAIDYSG